MNKSNNKQNPVLSTLVTCIPLFSVGGLGELTGSGKTKSTPALFQGAEAENDMEKKSL